MKRLNRKGFTIVELMIATLVFSMILLVVTSAIIQFGRIYYKGTVQSRTQERARAISDSIAKDIRFSRLGDVSINPASPGLPNTQGYICAGGHTYTFIKGTAAVERLVGGVTHGLVITDAGSCAAYPSAKMNTAALDPGAAEMLGERMQLAELNVTESATNPGVYTIRVRVAYGANASYVGSPGDPMQPCSSVLSGGQFCAFSDLTTTVVRRL